METKIEVGSVVYLKSGGPEMTVLDLIVTDQKNNKTLANCTWFDKNDQKIGAFPLAGLELSSKRPLGI